ncbi:hypothetical protein FOCC_FOCC007329 [Frankliniella occidentalis]|nr:hypothetical protein FOCC_FOCC007329 [Frankliniella occidentalis]
MLFNKVVQIVASHLELTQKVVVRLGGFHSLMSFIGAIGYAKSSSGIDDLWDDVRQRFCPGQGGTSFAAAKEALVFMIAKDNMPLSTTQREGFQTFCHTLQPNFKLPCSSMVTKEVEMSYERLREKFAAKLSVMESLTMTADIWTSQAMKSFLGVTAHFPEKLCAKPLKQRCSSVNLFKALQDVLSEWGINVQAVIGVVTDQTDGGANIVGAVKEVFGEKKHIGCFSHLLNGDGQAAIGLYSFRPSEAAAADVPPNDAGNDLPDDARVKTVPVLIQRVKKIITCFRTSTVATAHLERLQDGVPEYRRKKLIQEVRTSWNSTNEMLDRFLELSPNVSETLMKCAKKKSTKSTPPNMIINTDLMTLTEICKNK